MSIASFQHAAIPSGLPPTGCSVCHQSPELLEYAGRHRSCPRGSGPLRLWLTWESGIALAASSKWPALGDPRNDRPSCARLMTPGETAGLATGLGDHRSRYSCVRMAWQDKCRAPEEPHRRTWRSWSRPQDQILLWLPFPRVSTVEHRCAQRKCSQRPAPGRHGSSHRIRTRLRSCLKFELSWQFR